MVECGVYILHVHIKYCVEKSKKNKHVVRFKCCVYDQGHSRTATVSRNMARESIGVPMTAAFLFGGLSDGPEVPAGEDVSVVETVGGSVEGAGRGVPIMLNVIIVEASGREVSTLHAYCPFIFSDTVRTRLKLDVSPDSVSILS